jgi:hypothetical protein
LGTRAKHPQSEDGGEFGFQAVEVESGRQNPPQRIGRFQGYVCMYGVHTLHLTYPSQNLKEKNFSGCPLLTQSGGLYVVRTSSVCTCYRMMKWMHLHLFLEPKNPDP